MHTTTDESTGTLVLRELRREMNRKAVTIPDLASRLGADSAEVTSVLVDEDICVTDAAIYAHALGTNLGELLWRAGDDQ